MIAQLSRFWSVGAGPGDRGDDGENRLRQTSAGSTFESLSLCSKVWANGCVCVGVLPSSTARAQDRASAFTCTIAGQSSRGEPEGRVTVKRRNKCQWNFSQKIPFQKNVKHSNQEEPRTLVQADKTLKLAYRVEKIFGQRRTDAVWWDA